MAQTLRAFAALEEDLGSISSTHVVTHHILYVLVKVVSYSLMTSLWYQYTQARQTPLQIKRIFKKHAKIVPDIKTLQSSVVISMYAKQIMCITYT